MDTIHDNFSYTWTLILLFTILTSCTLSDKKTSENGVLLNEAENLELLADKLYNQDEFEEVIPIFDQLIAADSAKGIYYFRRGYSQARIRNDSDAVQDYLKSIELGHRVYNCYKNLGLIYSIGMLADDSVAIHYFEKALETDPQLRRKLKILLRLSEIRWFLCAFTIIFSARSIIFLVALIGRNSIALLSVEAI
ncbi:MAG: hypothetical protein U5K79_19420 [Cyclobacteriaceae bacterium]|nr:hypothetical protein [Cyclobacteriaceae bacterium]